MNFERIILSEISQTEKDKYVEWKKVKVRETENGVVTMGWGRRKWGDTGPKAYSSSYKMNTFWGSDTQHGEYS